MKKTILVIALMTASVAMTFSQGTIVYNNLGTIRAPVLITPAFPNTQIQGQPTSVIANSTPNGTSTYGAGAAGVSGTGFTAELWAGPDANNLTVVAGSQSGFRTGSTAGYFNQIATLPIAQFAPGSGGTLQLRAWNNAGGVNTWALALMNDLVLRGMSLPFTQATTGGVGTPPSAPATVTGFTAFNLFTPVPEPSLIALGALGLGALLLRRRKA